MIHVEQENLNSLAFNDVPITEMILDEENKILKVFFRGARIFDPSIPIFSNRIDMWLGKRGFSIQQLEIYSDTSTL